MKKISEQMLRIFVLLLISNYCMAQEVKVKKNEILVNGRAVAKIDRNKIVYTISDLNDRLMMTAIITNKTPLNNTSSTTWLQLTGTNGVVRELELQKSNSFSLGYEKPITENLVLGDNPIIGSDGINEAKMAVFFKTEDRTISKAADIFIEKNKRIYKEEDSVAKINNLVIDGSGTISAKGTKIGYIISKVTNDASGPGSGGMSGRKMTFVIADISKLIIAQIEFSTGSYALIAKQFELKTYNNKTFIYYPNLTKHTSDNLKEDEFAKRVVNTLYVNGYTLGDMKPAIDAFRAENVAKQNQIRQDAKNSSLNIYDTKGYVIDATGTKKEGEITIEFESIDEKLKIKSGISDITSYGSSVALKINNKNEFYKARDGIKFCVGTRCFLGAKSFEDGALGNNSGSQLSMLGESQFFVIEYESKGNSVLSHVKHPNDFYLKLSTQDKAVYLGDKGIFSTKTSDKIKKIFDKYVNCTSLDFSNYNTKTKEGLIEVIRAHQTGCSK